MNVNRAVDVTAGPFLFGPHVEHREPATVTFQSGSQVLHGQCAQRGQLVAAGFPGVDSALQVALNVIEAHSHQVRDDLAELGRIVEHDRGRTVVRQHPARPGRQVRAERNVDGARNVRGGERLLRADIDNEALITHAVVNLAGRDAVVAWQFGTEHARPLLVDLFHASEIRRSERHVGHQIVYPLRFGLLDERRVEAPLIANRR